MSNGSPRRCAGRGPCAPRSPQRCGRGFPRVGADADHLGDAADAFAHRGPLALVSVRDGDRRRRRVACTPCPPRPVSSSSASACPSRRRSRSRASSRSSSTTGSPTSTGNGGLRVPRSRRRRRRRGAGGARGADDGASHVPLAPRGARLARQRRAVAEGARARPLHAGLRRAARRRERVHECDRRTVGRRAGARAGSAIGAAELPGGLAVEVEAAVAVIERTAWSWCRTRRREAVAAEHDLAVVEDGPVVDCFRSTETSSPYFRPRSPTGSLSSVPSMVSPLIVVTLNPDQLPAAVAGRAATP